MNVTVDSMSHHYSVLCIQEILKISPFLCRSICQFDLTYKKREKRENRQKRDGDQTDDNDENNANNEKRGSGSDKRGSDKVDATDLGSPFLLLKKRPSGLSGDENTNITTNITSNTTTNIDKNITANIDKNNDKNNDDGKRKSGGLQLTTKNKHSTSISSPPHTKNKLKESKEQTDDKENHGIKEGVKEGISGGIIQNSAGISDNSAAMSDKSVAISGKNIAVIDKSSKISDNSAILSASSAYHITTAPPMPFRDVEYPPLLYGIHTLYRDIGEMNTVPYIVCFCVSVWVGVVSMCIYTCASPPNCMSVCLYAFMSKGIHTLYGDIGEMNIFCFLPI